VIAIENVRLFEEVQARTRELSEGFGLDDRRRVRRPGDRIGVAVDLHRTVRLNAPDQLACRMERRYAGDRFECPKLGAPEPLDWRLTSNQLSCRSLRNART
jgi:hypothetical protein